MADYPLLALLEPRCWLLVAAQTEFVHCARRAARHPDPWARAAGRAALGFAAEATGDVDTAEAHLTTAEQEYRRLGDQWSTAQMIRLISRFSSMRGNYPEAIRLLREAYAMLRDVGSSDDLAQLLIQLGNLQVRVGALDAAETSLRTALRGPLRPMPEYEVLVAAGLGEVATLREQPQVATELLARALHILDSVTYDRGYLQAEVLRRLGALHLSQGRTAEAKSTLEEARRLVTPLGDRSQLALIVELLAAVRLREGEPVSAAALLGAAAGLRGVRDDANPAVRELVAALDDPRYDDAYRSGRDDPGTVLAV